MYITDNVTYVNYESDLAYRTNYRFILSLVLLVCFYYTIPVIKTPFGFTTYIRLDDVISIIFVLISLSAIFNRKLFRATQFSGIIFLALALALPSATWGLFFGRIMKNYKYGIWQSVYYAKIFFIFLSMMVLPIDIKRYRRIFFIAWLGSVFVGVYGGLQYYGILSFTGWIEEFAQSGPWGGGEQYFANTALGPLSHSHACIASYMVLAAFIALFLVRTAHGISKTIYITSIPFFIVVILWSGARTGILGIMVGFIAYLISSRVRPSVIFGAIFGGIAIYIVITTVPAIERRFISHGGDYSSGRLSGWTSEISYLITHPLILLAGVGIGNFSYLRESVGLLAAHNNYLHWIVECGILGLTLPLIFLKRYATFLKELAILSPFTREAAIAIKSIFIAMLAIALTQEVFVPSPSMVSFPAYFAFLIGSTASLYRTIVLEHGLDS